MSTQIRSLLLVGTLLMAGLISHTLSAEDGFPPPFAPRPKAGYQYEPQDQERVAKILAKESESSLKDALKSSENWLKEVGEDSVLGGEARWVLGNVLVRERLPLAAQVVFSSLAREKAGTKPGEAALFELNELALQQKADEAQLKQLLLSHEFGRVHSEIESFLAYFRHFDGLRLGHRPWAEAERKRLAPDSPWSQWLKYWIAIGEVARGREPAAQEMLNQLQVETVLPERLRRLVTLQLARLRFGRQEYAAAAELYAQLVDLGVRDRGRVLLEQAWAKYYQRAYGESLGLLKALEGPFFAPSKVPERFLLQMLIYRDLCHYEAVQIVADRFQQEFSRSLAAIQNRESLLQDPVLVSWAFLHGDVQPQANLVDAIRREIAALSPIVGKKTYSSRVVDELVRREKWLRRQLELNLRPRLRVVAESLLDAREQIQFLAYAAKMDSLRLVKVGEDRIYEAEKVPYLTFDRQFWPVANEHWWDELATYQALISSRCDETASPFGVETERGFR